MANEDRISKTILKYEVEQASVNSALRSVETIERGFKTLEGNVGSVSATTKNLAVQIDALKRASALDQLTREFVNVGKSAKDFDGALISLRAGLKDVGASGAEIKQATAAFREYEVAAKSASAATGGGGSGFRLEGLRRTGSALNQLGLGAIGEPIQRAGDVGQVVKELQSAIGAMAGVGPAAEGAAVGSVAFSAAILPIAAIGAAAAVAFVAVSEGLKKSREEADHQIAVLDKFYETLHTGSATVAESQITEAKRNLADLEAKRASLQGKVDTNLNDPSTSPLQKLFGQVGGDTKEFTDAISKTDDEIKKAKSDLEGLTKALPELKIFRAVAVDIDIVKTAVENFTKASEDAAAKDAAGIKFYQSVVSANDEAKRTAAIASGEKAAADAKAISDRQNADAIKATEAYNTAKQKAVDDEEQAEADIKAKYASKVADILQAAVDAADAALEKLQQREADLKTGAGREAAKDERKAALEDTQAQIKARRTERDDLVSHLRKIEDIKKRFESQERDALLDRDFLALFRINENKNAEKTAENTAFEQQKADRQQALKDEQEDTALRRDYERKERFIALNQSLADARLAYGRELTVAAQKRDRALAIAASERDAAISLAIQKRADVLNILSDQYKNEVNLAYQASSVRQAILWNELAQAKQALAAQGVYLPGTPTTGFEGSNPQATSGSVTTIKRFASGGAFDAGTIGMINEGRRGQRESINGVRMPPGIGLFVATGAGKVTEDRPSIGSLTIPINIYESSNPRATYQIAKRAVVDSLEQVMGK